MINLNVWKHAHADNGTAASASGSPQTIHVTLNIFGFDLYLPIIRR